MVVMKVKPGSSVSGKQDDTICKQNTMTMEIICQLIVPDVGVELHHCLYPGMS